MLTTSTLYSDW